jgi:hypothetical protein
MKNQKLLKVVIVLLSLYTLMLIYTNSKLEKRDFSEAYNSCHKVWSARGLYGVDGVVQNSLESLDRAFRAGAWGAEIDLHYDIKMKRFIISHDHPTKGDGGELIYSKKNGKLLTLKEVFDTLGDGHYFWLDYKNLGKLSEEDTHNAIKRLLEITKKYNLRDRVYIEGTHPFKLASYTKSGFKTIFDIQPLPESYMTTTLVLNIYKAFFARGDFSVIGMHYGKLDKVTYGEKSVEILGDIPLFLYHVPDDSKLLDRLLANPQVRVMLVGRDINLNRFDRDSCDEEL